MSTYISNFFFFFFFQAEDGIRDKLVTGVQTCALPISPNAHERGASGHSGPHPRFRNAQRPRVHVHWVLHIHLRPERPRGADEERQRRGHRATENPSHIQISSSHSRKRAPLARRGRTTLGMASLGLGRWRERWSEVGDEVGSHSGNSGTGGDTHA